jgi:hypothetical protein
LKHGALSNRKRARPKAGKSPIDAKSESSS